MQKKQLQPRIIQTVTGVVLIFFILIYLVGAVYLNHVNSKQAYDEQSEKIARVAEEISFWQITTENLARRIALDIDLENRILIEKEISAAYSLTMREITNSLATYAHIEPGIQEITIYTTDGKTFSSSEFRGEFVPENNTWFMEFMESGKISGYTGVHESAPSQANITTPVITYIQPYNRIKNYKEKNGVILISLEFSSLSDILPVNIDQLSGFCLYNDAYDPIFSKGTVSVEKNELPSLFENRTMESGNGNILLTEDSLQDGWGLVFELSDRVVKQQYMILNLYFFLILAILMATLTIILRILIRNIVGPVRMLTEAAGELGNGNFEVTVDIHTGDELEILADVFNKMVKETRDLLEQSIENEKIKRKMQVDNLMLQINPHFIYNTLNSIIYMASETENEQIIQFTNAFISLLQNTLRPRNSIYISLREALENVGNYVVLQKYRYMDRFVFIVECDEAYKDCAIPNVVLQPIVENAIFHGIAPSESDHCTLMLKVEKAGDDLEIMIMDDGVGMTSEKAESLLSEEEKSGDMRKIGIGNVNNRLKEIYGSSHGLKIESAPGEGTKIILRIPFQRLDIIKNENHIEMV
ncbi:MAG: histidine kinase [Lachnospiraceae bacterium]|nr:histidine kinase [Lachnospiraceae bacterium]